VDLKDTLNLPRTDFPMRARLPEREPEILAFWEERSCYRRLRELRKGRPKFILHDGPPYANGDVHIGTALNKVLKDIVVRYASMRGYDSPYVPGWDTHGLPIELQALREAAVDYHELSPLELRERCRQYALRYVNIQREQFRRLGVWADWDNPYLTMDPAFEAEQIRAFGVMAARGYIYRGLKPVYWCASCETALAEAEVEYRDKVSPAIWVGFPVKDGKGKLPAGSQVLVWTTTPWTIPANTGIALHPEVQYVLVQTPRGPVLLAEARRDEVFRHLDVVAGRVLAKFSGRDLEGVVCRHPLYERDSLLILGEHVTLDQGTGCVHTSPGHGHEDFEVGARYGLPVLVPLDDRGIFTEEAGPFAGMFCRDADPEITRALDRAGVLWKAEEVVHQYPHCWRCKEPLLFRATSQWFASVEGFREQALEAVDQVTWIPAWARERIRSMVAERTDWCISRQRRWGVPLPALYCCDCEREVLDPLVIERVADCFAREGSDAWYRYPVERFLPDDMTCPHCGGRRFRKETDIMDVWFDSGTTHASVLRQREELRWPADIYLEGSDQHRGWFQSSLLTAVAVFGQPPYRTVLTHGFVVDGEGRKMSKSLGNVISPAEIIERYGADILRLWVSSADYRSDVRVSPVIIQQTVEAYRKIRNTFRFMLGNLADFQPERHLVEFDDLPEVDRWLLIQLRKLAEQVSAAYDRYEYHLVSQRIHNFCVVVLSNFYLDILKDPLYTFAAGDPRRRAAQTAMYHVACALVKMIAPVLCFTAEEVWQHLPKPQDAPVSVHLADWPCLPDQWRDPELEERWDQLLRVREAVSKALEMARAEKIIGSSLDAQVTVQADGNLGDLLRGYREELPGLFIVSEVSLGLVPDAPVVHQDSELGVVVAVRRAAAERCPRCWRRVPDRVRVPPWPEVCPRCAAVISALRTEGDHG